MTMANEDLIPLARLESELGISRVDLLLLLRRLGLEPIRRGMRTFLSPEDAASLVSSISSDGREAVVAELVPEAAQVGQLPVSSGGAWFKADLYADLRLFRERLDILERLMRTGIEIDSRELAELFQLKRLPAVEFQGDSAYFDRFGLRFWRRSRPGQRFSWRVSAAPDADGPA